MHNHLLDNEAERTALLDKYYQGTCTKEELELLFDFFQRDTFPAQSTQWMQQRWEEQPAGFRLPPTHSDLLQQQIHQQLGLATPVVSLPKQRSIITRTAWTAAAAAVILLLSATVYLLVRKPAEQQLALTSIIHPAGKRAAYNLPDGSKVWLNGGSTISYPVSFHENRELTLSGEAYFEVTAQAAAPFKVHTGAVTTTVLGTSFNVSAYPHQQPHIAVTSGRVKVEGQAIASALLNAGEQAATHATGFALSKFTTNDAIAWTENRLVFNNTSLKEVAGKLANWYNRKIVIHDTTKSGCAVEGEFRNASLKEVLNTLQFTHGFTYSESADSIIIRNGTCL